jgi:CheY-like chemotaxis protein
MSPVVLLADDDENFALLVQHAFAKAWPTARLQCVNDGKEAIQYLLGHEQYANREQFPFPSLMLLDLNMPRVNGFEVLEWKAVQLLWIPAPHYAGVDKTANQSDATTHRSASCRLWRPHLGHRTRKKFRNRAKCSATHSRKSCHNSRKLQREYHVSRVASNCTGGSRLSSCGD